MELASSDIAIALGSLSQIVIKLPPICDPDLATCYDIGCSPGGVSDFDDFMSATEYLKDIEDTCDEDIDCYMAGSRWSHVFLM